jgi:hypothetical protein
MTTSTVTHTSSSNNGLNFVPFKPQSDDENTVAHIMRSMLHYHILRVQLEGSRPWMHDKQRVRARREAIEARRQGFIEERDTLDAGIRVSYDDELLRKEATSIAYLLCRDQVEKAMNLEEEVITISVNHALYGTDIDAMRIAA